MPSALLVSFFMKSIMKRSIEIPQIFRVLPTTFFYTMLPKLRLSSCAHYPIWCSTPSSRTTDYPPIQPIQRQIENKVDGKYPNNKCGKGIRTALAHTCRARLLAEPRLHRVPQQPLRQPPAFIKSLCQSPHALRFLPFVGLPISCAEAPTVRLSV